MKNTYYLIRKKKIRKYKTMKGGTPTEIKNFIQSNQIKNLFIANNRNNVINNLLNDRNIVEKMDNIVKISDQDYEVYKIHKLGKFKGVYKNMQYKKGYAAFTSAQNDDIDNNITVLTGDIDNIENTIERNLKNLQATGPATVPRATVSATGPATAP